MFPIVQDHLGCPEQNPDSRKTVVCVCVCVWLGRQGSLALAGSLSRRRKTDPKPGLTEPASLFRHFRDTLHVTAVLTNLLGSSLPLGSEYVSLETWDDGARRLLTLKTSRRRLGGQPAVGA